jgi:hypothetical protein
MCVLTQDIRLKAEACVCKLRADQSPDLMLCERRVDQEKLANTIAPSAGGNREVVITSSLRT